MTDLANLSAARINEMTAALLGQPVKRAASKADAIARYQRAAGSVTLAAPASVAEEPAPVVDAVANPAPAKPARVRRAAGKRAAAASPKAKAKPARKPAAEKAAATPGEPRAGSKRAAILDMIRRPGGATEAEVCAALGWVAAAATIGRVLRNAGVTPRREKDVATGRVRFFAK